MSSTEEYEYDYEEQGGSKSRVVVILLIIATVLMAGLAAYMFVMKNKSEESEQVAISQKDEIKKELDQLETKYSSLESDMNVSAQEKADLQAQIKSLRRSLYKAKVDAKALKSLRAEVVDLKIQIADLETRNKQLTAEKETLSKALESGNSSATQERDLANAKLRQMEDQVDLLKKKVAIASLLKVGNLQLRSYKVSRSGKRVAEGRAKKVNQFSVNFTIAKNELTPSGKYSVYVRIEDPDGNLVVGNNADTNQVIKLNDKEVGITFDLKVEYKSEDTAPPYVANMDAESGSFQPGTYKATLYSKDGVMGETYLDLE